MEHGLLVVRVERLDEHELEDGQTAQHVRREPPFRRQHLNLTPDLFARAHELRQRHQQLRELAADRLVDPDRLYDPCDVRDLQPLRHPVERVEQRVAERSLGQDAAELFVERRGCFLHHHLDRVLERVAGFQ